MRNVILCSFLFGCGSWVSNPGSFCKNPDYYLEQGICVTENGLDINNEDVQTIVTETINQFLVHYPDFDTAQINGGMHIDFVSDVKNARGRTSFNDPGVFMQVERYDDCAANSPIAHEMLHGLALLHGVPFRHDNEELFTWAHAPDLNYCPYWIEAAENQTHLMTCYDMCGLSGCIWLAVVGCGDTYVNVIDYD